VGDQPLDQLDGGAMTDPPAFSDPLVDREAEQLIIGCMLNEPIAVLPQVNGINFRDFVEPLHQLAFAAATNIHQAGGLPTFSAIFQRLRGDDLGLGLSIEQIADHLQRLVTAYSASLPEDAGRASHRISELATRRQLAQAYETAAVALRHQPSRPIGEIQAEIPTITPKPNGARFLSADDFVAGYRPQRPLIRAWDLKPGWLYSFTAPTGYAKTAIALSEAMQLSRDGKRVVYLAGENPDEVRARVLLMKAKLGSQLPPTLKFVDGTLNLKEALGYVRSEVQAMSGADLVVVDTSPAFEVAAGGAEENSNTEQLAWALILRQLTKLEGNPTVLALCHPVKKPQTVEDLLPRGGSSYLAEVDGNYASWLTAEDGDRKFFDFTWVGKFRGGFEPLPYVVEKATCEALVDPDGNSIESVWAYRADEQQVERATANQAEDDDVVLVAMNDYPGKSLSDWAKILDWHVPSGPAKHRVRRAIKRLQKHKLCVLSRDDHYCLTKTGKEEAKRVSERLREEAK
jgi:hypothetical protein